MKSKQFQVALGTLAVFFAASALAQQDQGPELEEVVVTGSYLYTGADSPSPAAPAFDCSRHP